MRVIELLVDGQRIKLTTDENVARAIGVGDLKPATRVVIWESGEEDFVGAAMDDPRLRALFPPEMLPVDPVLSASEEEQDDAAADDGDIPTPVLVPMPLSRGKTSRSHAPYVPVVEVEPATVTRVKETVVANPEPERDELERRLLAARLLHEQMEREKAARIALAKGLEPKPWRHWLAKCIDLPILVVLGSFSGALIGVMAFEEDPVAMTVLSIIMIFVVEALIMKIFGATPGKALLNIRVRKNGRHIGFFAGVGRSLQSHIVGAGAWIPLLSVLTMFAARRRMLELGRSAWDYGAGNEVTYGPIGVLRVLAILGIFVGLYMLVGMMSSL